MIFAYNKINLIKSSTIKSTIRKVLIGRLTNNLFLPWRTYYLIMEAGAQDLTDENSPTHLMCRNADPAMKEEVGSIEDYNQEHQNNEDFL